MSIQNGKCVKKKLKHQFFRFTISMHIFEPRVLLYCWKYSEFLRLNLFLFCFCSFPLALEYQNTMYKGNKSNTTLRKTYPKSSFPASKFKYKIRLTKSEIVNTIEKDRLF